MGDFLQPGVNFRCVFFYLACLLNYFACFSFYLAFFVLVFSIKCDNKIVRCKLLIGRDGECAKEKMGFLAEPGFSGGKCAVPCGTITEQRFLREPAKVTEFILSKK